MLIGSKGDELRRKHLASPIVQTVVSEGNADAGLTAVAQSGGMKADGITVYISSLGIPGLDEELVIGTGIAVIEGEILGFCRFRNQSPCTHHVTEVCKSEHGALLLAKSLFGSHDGIAGNIGIGLAMKGIGILVKFLHGGGHLGSAYNIGTGSGKIGTAETTGNTILVIPHGNHAVLGVILKYGTGNLTFGKVLIIHIGFFGFDFLHHIVGMRIIGVGHSSRHHRKTEALACFSTENAYRNQLGIHTGNFDIGLHFAIYTGKGDVLDAFNKKAFGTCFCIHQQTVGVGLCRSTERTYGTHGQESKGTEDIFHRFSFFAEI